MREELEEVQAEINRTSIEQDKVEEGNRRFIVRNRQSCSSLKM